MTDGSGPRGCATLPTMERGHWVALGGEGSEPAQAGLTPNSNEDTPSFPGWTLWSKPVQNATVWLASNHLGHRRAIKVIPGDAAVAATWRNFASHRAHVVPVSEVLIDRTGTRIGLVMPQIGSTSLEGLIARGGALPPGQVVTAVTSIAVAVAAMHSDSLVHGAIEASHVLIDEAGRPWLTGPKPGRKGTSAADVAALGELCWSALLGERRREADSFREAVLACDATIPAAMVELIDRALSPYPQHRPTAERFAVELFDSAPAEPFRVGTSTGTHRGSLARDDRRRHRGAGSRVSMRAAWARPVPAATAAVGVVGCAAMVAGIVIGLGDDQRTPTAQVTPTHAMESTASNGAGLRARTAPSTSASPGRSDVRRGSAMVVAQQLCDARARLFTTLDTGVIATVDVPGSPAATADAAAIARARTARIRYVAVDFTVREATLTPTAPDAATLRVTYDSAAHQTVRAGVVTSRPAQPGLTTTVRLTRVGGHWRIAEIIDAGRR